MANQREMKEKHASCSYLAIPYLLLIVLGRVFPGSTIISSEGYVAIKVDLWRRFSRSKKTIRTQILPSSMPAFSNRMFCTCAGLTPRNLYVLLDCISKGQLSSCQHITSDILSCADFLNTNFLHLTHQGLLQLCLGS
jgi:hypothetical protein